MIVLITMIALISSYLLANVLTRTSTEVRIDNDQRTLQALREAKAALIAYAASQAWDNDPPSQAYNTQPGSLPCPATDEGGDGGSSCTTTSTRVGRLPWKKIGANKLYDGSGNVLWYAVSANFVRNPGTTIINSDTQGTLTLTGASPASNIVAVVIAPGSPLGGQSRTTSSALNTYLETTDGTNDSFSTVQPLSDTFNDLVMPITRAELMAVVEPAVAARIERDIKPYLTTYASQWSNASTAYPFPTPFFNQSGASQTSYAGTSGTQYGLLPLTASLSYPWVSGSGAVAATGGTVGSTVTITSCATTSSPTSGWKCSFSLKALDAGVGYLLVDTCKNPSTGVRYRYCMDNPAFTVAGDVSNAGLSLANINPTTATDITVTNTSGSTARTMSSKSIAATLKSSGAGTFTFSGTHTYSNYSNTNFTRAMAVTIPDRVTVSSATSATDASAGWFIKQQWYRQTYYAVAAGYLPGGTGSCTAGTDCLTVNNLTSPINNKRAILILLGSPLQGINGSTSRPSASLSDYAEGQNTTPADHIFAHTRGTSTTTNDRVVVIAP